jgi:hypothetical protein
MRVRTPDDWELFERTANAAGVSPLEGRTRLLASGDAARFVEVCRATGVRIVGIEGFHVRDSNLTPDIDSTVDLSSIIDVGQAADEATAFLDDVADGDLAYDFVLVAEGDA